MVLIYNFIFKDVKFEKVKKKKKKKIKKKKKMKNKKKNMRIYIFPNIIPDIQYHPIHNH